MQAACRAFLPKRTMRTLLTDESGERRATVRVQVPKELCQELR